MCPKHPPHMNLYCHSLFDGLTPKVSMTLQRRLQSEQKVTRIVSGTIYNVSRIQVNYRSMVIQLANDEVPANLPERFGR